MKEGASLRRRGGRRWPGRCVSAQRRRRVKVPAGAAVAGTAGAWLPAWGGEAPAQGGSLEGGECLRAPAEGGRRLLEGGIAHCSSAIAFCAV